ncbi:carbohydrate ABC transporter permease [Cohnella rhizosphaerae]|uniref:Carbohydrate ABC transporter permease n=1 Tax=Cohnella rhizosphaerae TaxID=1457232 RepID=A0A9X4KVF3_9BACL|nr:carbohydrate ABC transporter permease [Cohnella rhizosphaerae]MDG0811622.1 carbohydrate ABC transporter permease [Cohnella rhizosphaerae]
MRLRPKRTPVSAAFLWIYALLTLLLLCYMTYQSLRPKKELLSATFGMPKHLGFGNFRKLFAEAGFFTYLLNSALILFGSLVLVVLLSTMVAYGIGKFNFRFKSGLLLYFLIGLMFPVQLGIVPIFLLIRDMHLLNSQWAVILVLASGLSMPVFLLTTFFAKLPHDLYESAKIDGAGEWTTFTRVMFPLASPVTFSVCIIMSMQIWNQFFVPLIFLQSESRKTIPLMIMKFTTNVLYNMDLALVGSVMATVPLLILFFFFSGRVIEGVAAGGVKG